MDIKPYQDRLDKFFNEVAALQHCQRLTQNVAKQAISDLQQREKNLEPFSDEDKELFGRSISVFSFYNPYTGTIMPYATKKLSLKETAKLVFEHKNKQYQWLLVEAYELYEDFIVSLYEFIRTDRPELRFSKDANGSLLPAELKNKVSPIVNQLRSKLKEFKKIELVNEIHKNLRLYLCMTEKFRHIIVHRKGITADPDKLVEDILKKANLLGDHENEPDARKTISNYLGTGEYKGYVVLEEHSLVKVGGFSIDINRHENLVNALMAHAFALTQSLVNYLCAQVEVSS